MKHLRLSAVLTGALAMPAFACDVCSVYSAAQARGEVGQGLFAGAAEQFTRYGTLQDESHKAPNDVGQYLDSSVSQLFIGYNFNERFGVQLNLPVIYRSFKRPEGFDVEWGTVSGLGDISLIGHWAAFHSESKRHTLSWILVGGVKLPTGSSDRLEEELSETEIPGAPESGVHGHDLALGSGSVDGIVGAGFYGRWHRLFLRAGMQYAIRTKGDFDYRYANDLTWGGGPGYFLALNEDYTVALQLSVSGETKGRDAF